MKKETWKKLENFSRYEISNLGRVKRVPSEFFRQRKTINHPERIVVQQRILTPSVDNVGRLHYRLFNDQNEIKLFKLTRLVWLTFNGPIPAGYQVDHIDGNRFNNSLDNLQLLTKSDNIAKRKKDPKWILICNQTGEKIKQFKCWCNKKELEFSTYQLWKSLYDKSEYMDSGYSFERVLL